MTSVPIPEDIQKFLDASIPSVEQLEVLLTRGVSFIEIVLAPRSQI